MNLEKQENYCPNCNGKLIGKKTGKKRTAKRTGNIYNIWIFTCEDCGYSEERATESDIVIQNNILTGIKQSRKL